MEGSRLILKRKIPRGRERLVAIFAGAFVIAGLVMVAQLKTTLSARALGAVRSDLTDMRVQFGEDVNAATEKADTETPTESTPAPSAEPTGADKAVEKFKQLLQDSSANPQ
jgi:hypothetical protein